MAEKERARSDGDDTELSAPEPLPEPKAESHVTLRTVQSNRTFIAEGVTVTHAGVKLSDSVAKKIESLAAKSRVAVERVKE